MAPYVYDELLPTLELELCTVVDLLLACFDEVLNIYGSALSDFFFLSLASFFERSFCLSASLFCNALLSFSLI
jgi:hypothetical protein